MPRRLKIFRTPIGFHDAYVAAPSRKAALQAWGADVDLFARGAAEEVTDPALTADALASPGTVIRKTRGTMDDHMARMAAHPERTTRQPRADAPRKVAPRPSRANLDDAEAALADAEGRQQTAMAELAAREAALARERRSLEQDHAAERNRLDRARVDAAAAYHDALAAWRDD